MRLAVAALICVAISPSWAADRVPAFPKREPYARARETLLLLGWRPAHDKVTDDRCWHGDERCNHYPEVESCAGSGLGNCNFAWIGPTETVINVGTVGENVPTVVGVECRANCRR